MGVALARREGNLRKVTKEKGYEKILVGFFVSNSFQEIAFL
jgi:hypothetical protein